MVHTTREPNSSVHKNLAPNFFSGKWPHYFVKDVGEVLFRSVWYTTVGGVHPVEVSDSIELIELPLDRQ